MTKEEVYNYLNEQLKGYCRDFDTHEHIDIENVHSVDEKPEKEIACFVVKGDGVYYGSYEDGKFGYYKVTNGLFEEHQTPLEGVEWYIPYNEIYDVPKEKNPAS